MSNAAAVACVVLAGGRSRRMGQDKALLKLPNGQSLLSRTVEVGRRLCLASAECGVDEETLQRSAAETQQVSAIVVTPWPERYQPLFSAPVDWIEDTQEAGPLAGFAQAWPKIQSDWCLLLACDLPNLDVGILSKWWQWLETLAFEASFQASLVRREGRWEPLCGFYHRSCLESLERHLEEGNSPTKRQGQRDFQSWLSRLNIATYTDVPSEMLFNCNRPSDWAKISE